MPAVTRMTLRASSFSTCLRAIDFAEADIGAWDAPENPEHMDYVAIEPTDGAESASDPADPRHGRHRKEGQSADPRSSGSG